MQPLSRNHLALGHLSFPRGGGCGLLRLLRLMLIVLSCLSFISAAPAADGQHAADVVLEARQRDKAGLAWGPVQVGQFTMGVTNPHMGVVKPKYPYPVMHTNVRVWKQVKNKNVDVANLHVVPSVEGGKRCWYVYESVSQTVVLDSCWGDWPEAYTQVTKAVDDFLTNLFQNANLLEKIALIGALIAVLVTLLDGLAAAAVVVAV
jgi:hypothetical protein